MLMLLLATFSRCVDMTPCPTNREIEDAVRTRDNAREWAILNYFSETNPGEIIFTTQRRMKSISNVICGDAIDDEELPTLMCRVTIKYAGCISFEVLKLQKQSKGWSVVDGASVSRDDP